MVWAEPQGGLTAVEKLRLKLNIERLNFMIQNQEKTCDGLIELHILIKKEKNYQIKKLN